MSEPCYSAECCDKDPLDTDSHDSTNCPDGYVWGGLGCVPEDSPQPCSTGYAWDGTECIADDDDFECAEGYHLIGDDCVECDKLTAPTVQFITIGHAHITCDIPVNTTEGTVYCLENEVEIATATEYPDPGAWTFQFSADFDEGKEYCFYFVVETTDCGTLTSPRTCVIFTSGLLP